MNTHNIIVTGLAIVIGFGGGYILGSDNTPRHDMHMMMQDMTLSLQNKEGVDFEKAFIDEMIVHHEGAVLMAQMVLEQSTRPELLQLANEIIAAQTSEITMMRGWRAEWFGNDAHHAQ